MLQTADNVHPTEIVLENGKLVQENVVKSVERTELVFNETTGELVSFKNILTKEEAERLAPGYTTDKGTAYWLTEDGKIHLVDSITFDPMFIGQRVTVGYRIALFKKAAERFSELRKKEAEKKADKITTFVI